MNRKPSRPRLYRIFRFLYHRRPASLFLFSLSAVFLLWLINFLMFRTTFEGRLAENTGAFGDSFGGLTSLFTGLAFAGLIASILFQQREISLQRKEMRRQREELSGQRYQLGLHTKGIDKQAFESTFFNALSTFETYVGSISTPMNGGVKVHGREALTELVRQMNVGAATPANIAKNFIKIREQQDVHLGPYFRTLYNLFKLVDRSDREDRKFYMDFIRARLSPAEVILLNFNASTQRGQKAVQYVKRYRILKHSPEDFGKIPMSEVRKEIADLEKCTPYHPDN